MCLTPGFGSGHDLTVPGFEHCIGLSNVSAEPPRDSLSLNISALPEMLCLCLTQNQK